MTLDKSIKILIRNEISLPKISVNKIKELD